MFDNPETSARIASLEKKFAHLIAQDPKHWLGIAVGPGWVGIVEALLERIDRELSPFELRRLRLVQIKQKLAELRVYYDLDGSLARLHLDVVGGAQRMCFVSGRDSPLSAKVDELIRAAAAHRRSSRRGHRSRSPARRRRQVRAAGTRPTAQAPGVRSGRSSAEVRCARDKCSS